jgi:integrase
MFAKLEQKVTLGGLSESTLVNYGRCIAKISLYFKQVAINLDEEQINGYLFDLLKGDTPSKSYFKHTVYGLRYLFRIYDKEDKAIRLPNLKKEAPLPVVLSKEECRKLFKAGRMLKHRILLCLIYSAGLRQREVRSLLQSDIDFDRMQIHIRRTKYDKERYVPLSTLMAKGLKKYYSAYTPKRYVFNGKDTNSPLSPRGVQWGHERSVKKPAASRRMFVSILYAIVPPTLVPQYGGQVCHPLAGIRNGHRHIEDLAGPCASNDYHHLSNLGLEPEAVRTIKLPIRQILTPLRKT